MSEDEPADRDVTDDLARRVITAVARFAGLSSAITLEADLFEDLGIAGDDGTELIVFLAETFRFSFDAAEVSAVFGPEAVNPFGMLYRLVRDGLRPPPPEPERFLEVADLVRAAETGRLEVRSRPPLPPLWTRDDRRR